MNKMDTSFESSVDDKDFNGSINSTDSNDDYSRYNSEFNGIELNSDDDTEGEDTVVPSDIENGEHEKSNFLFNNISIELVFELKFRSAFGFK